MNDNLLDRVVVAIGTQYLVDGEIGRGGSAVVYRGTDLKLGRQVAIKVLPPELAYNESVRTRFIREAQTAAGLSHPNIVPIYSVDEKDGLVYFVMSLVVGQSVASHLAQEHRWPVDRTERVLREVADALAYAHSRGVVHRDIKPDNILIERDTGRALVSDFGIARASEGETRLTLTGVAVGTPAYMSPEQALGERELDGRSDVYSLGVVGYHMLTGEQPFKASSAAAMLVKHVSEIPPRVASKRADVPAYLAMALDRALSKRPEDRWANASEFRDALAGAIQLPPQAYPIFASQGTIDRNQRHNYPPPAERPQAPPPPQQDAELTFAAFYQPAPPPPGMSRWEMRRWNRQQERHRREAANEYRIYQMRRHAAAIDSRAREKFGDSYDDKPLVDRVIAFRGSVFRFMFFTPFLGIINAATGGDFPWFLFPSGVFLFDAIRRAGSIWSDGVGPLEAFKKGIRIRLTPPGDMSQLRGTEQQRRQELPAVGSAAAARPVARADRFVAPPPDRALTAVSREVMNGAHGAAVRRALDDTAVIREVIARLGPLEREMLPDVGPTVDALAERVANLATTLHRLDLDVSGGSLGSLDQRIASLKGESTAGERERTLSLLERQRASLHDLLLRRQTLLAQLDSAGLALQNLKLDLLKLRSAGVSAAMGGEMSATQEARSVSKDIGRIIEVADDMRDIGR
ncbi:MAG TPA: protein kinase [Gemmatimonadaceae bacterium]|nr:protein kinase [Gemmatimonadaceae bacterium]